MKIAGRLSFIAVIFTAMLGITACSTNQARVDNNIVKGDIVTPSNSPDLNEKQLEEISKVPGLVISGRVTYNELESGFYQIDGYRLSGGQDFAKYNGNFTVVTGNPDDSPSIYMVKTINVRDIIAKEDADFSERMEKLINEYSEAIKKAQAAGESKESVDVISNNLSILQALIKDESSAKISSEIKEGFGKYTGQADSNFIEIEIDSKTFNVFQLSDELKDKFGELSLRTGDTIQFKYRERVNQNPEILEIVKN